MRDWIFGDSWGGGWEPLGGGKWGWRLSGILREMRGICEGREDRETLCSKR